MLHPRLLDIFRSGDKPLSEPMITVHINHFTRADTRFAPSQWETVLLCNDVSLWLGASLESALFYATCIWYYRHQKKLCVRESSGCRLDYYWWVRLDNNSDNDYHVIHVAYLQTSCSANQLFMKRKVHGKGTRSRSLCVPISLENIYIRVQ